jgi:DNA polymerase
MLEWEDLIVRCSQCQDCSLYVERKNVVIGRGNINAPLVFVGEGPGEQEDLLGLPFVGPAGNLLNTLLTALNIKEDMYYITNIVKCRPPKNRVPLEEEAKSCLPFLRNQVKLIKPKILVCLGATALKYIVDENAKITSMRGTWIEKKGYHILPTFHPAALLRDSSKKILMWQDFKKIEKRLQEICLNKCN